MAGVTFSKSAAEKIGRAVGAILNPTRDRAGASSPTYPAGTEFLAMLLGCDATGHRYTFYRVVPAPEQLHPDVFTVDGDAMKYVLEGEASFDAAREANGTRGVPAFAIVRMTFTGYDKDGEPTYIFFHHETTRPWEIPPHDHRDNYNGGFAFSVYHPGTYLPQSRFAI